MLRRYRPPKPIEPWKGPKPKLRMRITHEYRVHYLDLQAYLAKVYKMDGYDVLRTTGVTNGICPEYLVTGQMPPTSNIGQQTDNIRRGRRVRSLDLILNVLCEDGFIPNGKYVIDTEKRPDPLIEYTNLLNEHCDPDHPTCVAFRKQQRHLEFQRRAARLDRLTLDFRQQLEQPDECT